MKSSHAAVWVNYNSLKVRVLSHDEGSPADNAWQDIAGRAYLWWNSGSARVRVQSMLELLVKLGGEGFDLNEMVREFSAVDEFYELGRESVFMCNALTRAWCGKVYDPVTMTFDELMDAHRCIEHVPADVGPRYTLA